METAHAPRKWEQFFELSFARNYHLAVAFIIYMPFIFLGYGGETDSYLVVSTGRRLLADGTYFPSRRPGSLVYEFAESLLDHIGGSMATNLGTLLMSLLFLALFTSILKKLLVPMREYLVWVLILMPIYWNASTITLDYLWAISLSMAGFYMGLKRNYFGASVLWALSIGARLPTVVTLAGFVLFFWLERPADRRKVLASAVLSGLLGALFFIPSYFSAGSTLNFLDVGVNVGDPSLWTPYLRAGRFVYKNLYVWGLPASVGFALLLAGYWRELRRLLSPNRRSIAAACAFIVVAYEAFFLKYPMKVEYLLPMIPFLLILVGIWLEGRPKAVVALLCATALYNVLSINVAEPDLKWRAREATYAVKLERGMLLHLVDDRMLYRHCEDIQCVARANAALIRRIQLREKTNILF